VDDAHHPGGDETAEGLAAYQAGLYWDAHERWEHAWRRLAGDERLFVQGLIMLAASAWHAERGHGKTARQLLERAAPRLQTMVTLPGLSLRADLPARVRAALARTTLSVPPVSLRPD
jgi:predicted metal-dependent hydrolase